jgi:hypothetical protein
VVGLDCEKERSCNNFQNQTTFVVAFANAMYSDSMEDNATDCCFLLP